MTVLTAIRDKIKPIQIPDSLVFREGFLTIPDHPTDDEKKAAYELVKRGRVNFVRRQSDYIGYAFDCNAEVIFAWNTHEEQRLPYKVMPVGWSPTGRIRIISEGDLEHAHQFHRLPFMHSINPEYWGPYLVKRDPDFTTVRESFACICHRDINQFAFYRTNS